MGDFGAALFAGRLPAVSFITAKGAFDDSDGWYDHAMDVVVNQSNVSEDALTGDGACGVTEAAGTPGRCGYGPRLPLLVISPYARHNYVDHTITDQASILRFIEDNWGLGRIGGGSLDVKSGTLDGFFDFNGSKAHALILDQATGQPCTIPTNPVTRALREGPGRLAPKFPRAPGFRCWGLAGSLFGCTALY